jgi:hypothetical protein
VNDADSIADGPAVYRVKVEGHIPLSWSDRLLGMNITTADSEDSSISIIVGRLPDQAALAGIMNTLCEQRFAVLSVECLEKG